MKTPQWLNIIMIIIAIFTFIINITIFSRNFPTSFYIMILSIVLIFIFLPRAIVSSPEKIRTTLIHNMIVNTGTNTSWTGILVSFAIIVPMLIFKFNIWIKLIGVTIIFIVLIIYGVSNYSKPIEEKREVVEKVLSSDVMNRVRRRQPINFAVICVTIVVFGIIYYIQADQNLFVLLGSFIIPLIIISFYNKYVSSL